MSRIALISSPWPLFNRPSVQLGSLNTFLKGHLPDTCVHAYHFYLTIAKALGYDLYKEISETIWLGEAPYAALLYPERLDIIQGLWKKRSSNISRLRNRSFKELCLAIEDISSNIIDKIEWSSYTIAGLSICFGQLTSSLFFIREIKRRARNMTFVVGGSGCAGDQGKMLLQTFPDIDFVISGEGELPLLHLVRSLEEGKKEVANFPGLIKAGNETGNKISQVKDIDSLPLPDYSDYYEELQSCGRDRSFIPSIPMEVSRGCWWQKKAEPETGIPGCAFCNLNLQWQGYRAKSRARVLSELEQLTQRYRSLSFSFMDNLLPRKGNEDLFREINDLGKDFRLFSEIRATTPLNVLAEMGAAGMEQIQVGVEALSTRLLRKLNKGITAIDNMEILKHCETPGMPSLTGNLILRFPSSSSQDVEETLANLDFAFPFRPLRDISFWLGYGSDVWHRPAAYGIRLVGNHPFYKRLFPPEIVRSLRLMIQGYHGGVRYQRRLWRPVEDKCREWRKNYWGIHKGPGFTPILSYHDGGEFLVIRERRSGKQDMTHRLQGTSRKIYLFCNTSRHLQEILAGFPGFGEEKILPFLRMMNEKRLMFREGNKYLALAVPARGCRRVIRS